MNKHIELIKSLGLRVYQPIDVPAERLTWCHFTDGTRIGYAQWGGYETSVSSVHAPNKQTGTGFRVADEITAETVRSALETIAPHWASGRDRESVHKYSDFDAFSRASSFKLQEV